VTKRISCRVVRTVPLANGNCTFRYVSHKYNKVVDAAGESDKRGDTVNSVTYTSRLNISSVSFDIAAVGQALDCYI